MAGSSMFDVSFKAFNGQFNIDEAEGIVECFVAAIGNKDSVGDVVLSGAFNESLKRRKPRVVWGHSWNDPIGKVLEIYEVPPNDPRLPAKMKQAGVGGLYAKVQFNLATEKGREAFASVAFFGHEQEWSIGYKTLQATFDPNIQANMLKEVELYEVSPVLHGANQLTATLSVKSDEAEKCNMPMSGQHMGMPGFGPQQTPKLVVVRLEGEDEEEDDEDEEEGKSRDLFAEGEARSISPEMRNALEMELMSRSDEPIKVINATENSAVFVRKIGDAKLTYRISYHYDDDAGEFMFGKPERISGAAEARATGTTVIPSQMPGMPMTVKPGVSMPMQPTQMLMQKYGIDESSIADERLKQAIALLGEVMGDQGKSIEPETFSVYVKTEQIYEAKQLIDPVLQYHRLEYEIDDEGIHVISPLSQESREALRTARKSVYTHFGRGSLGKAEGASDSSGAPEHQEIKALGGKLGARIGGGLRSAGPGMSFVDITGTVDADTDGIVFEGKPGLERPIIPRFTVPKELARKLSKLTVGDAEAIERQRRAGNTNIQFDENRLRSLIRDLGEDPSALSRMDDDGNIPAQPAGARSINRLGQMGQSSPSLSGMSNDELQREWDANKPYRPRPGVIGMNPMLEDDKVARRREVLKEMRKRGMEPEGGVPADMAATEFLERARGEFDRLKPPSKPLVRRTPPDPNRLLGQSGSRSGFGGRIDQTSSSAIERLDLERRYRDTRLLTEIQDRIDALEQEKRAWEMGGGKFERNGVTYTVNRRDQNRADKAQEKIDKLKQRLDLVKSQQESRDQNARDKAQEAVRPLSDSERERMEDLRSKVIDPRTGKPYSKAVRQMRYQQYLKDYWKRRMEAEKTDFNLRYSDFNGGDFEQYDEMFKENLRKLRALERRDRGGPISPRSTKPTNDPWKNWDPKPLMGGSRSKSLSKIDNIFDLADRLDEMQETYRNLSSGKGREDTWKEMSTIDKRYTSAIDDLHKAVGVGGLYEESRRLRDAADATDDRFEKQALMRRAKFIDDNLVPWFRKLDDKARRQQAGARSYSGPTVNGISLPVWDELSSMRRINGPTGLNKGYWFRDDSTGRTFFAKLGRSDEHAQSEAAASAIYRVAGSGVPSKAVINGEGGKMWVVSEKLPDLTETARPSREIQDLAKLDMGVDMLLQNRDGWSGGSNKLIGPDGSMYTIDTGGAGIFRAQGGDKYPPFSPDAPWEDVATLVYRPNASWQHMSGLYGRVSNEDFVRAMQQVASIDLVEADSAMKEVGTPDAMRQQFIDTIAARQKIARDYIDEFSEYDPSARVDVSGSSIRPGGSRADGSVPAGSRSRVSDRRTVDEFLSTEQPTGSITAERRRINFEEPDDERDGLKEWLGSSGAVLQIEEDGDGGYIARLLRETDDENIDTVVEDIFPTEGEARRFLNREYSAMARGMGARSTTAIATIDDDEAIQTSRFWPGHTADRSFNWAKPDRMTSSDGFEKMEWDASQGSILMMTRTDLPGRGQTEYTSREYSAWLLPLESGEPGTPSAVYGEMIELDIPSDIDRSNPREVGRILQSQEDMLKREAQQMAVLKRRMDDYDSSVGSRSRASDRRAIDEFLSTEQPTGSLATERRRINFNEPDDEANGLREWYGSSGTVLQIEEQGDGSFVGRLAREVDGTDQLETISEDIFASDSEAKRFLNREYSSVARQSGSRSRVATPDAGERTFESERNAIEDVAFMSMLDVLSSEDVFGDDALTPDEIANYLESNIVPQGKERTVSAAWSQHDSIINDPIKQRRMGLRSTSQPITGRQLADRQMVDRDNAGRIVPKSTLDEALAARYGRVADRLREIGMSDDEIGQLIGNGLRSRSRLSEVSRPGYPRSFDEYVDNPLRGGARSKSGMPVPRYPRTVGMGAFIGSAEDEFDGIDNWEDLATALRGKEIVFLDYETTGIVFDQHEQVLSKGIPTQIGAVKVKDGKVIGRFNLYVNPGSPKSEWEEWSQKTLKDPDGNLITDEFMADKPSVADAHQQLVDFIGETQLLGMQNAPFDNDVLTAALEAAGIDWRPSGIIDTKELADVAIPKYSAENTDAPFQVGKGNAKYASTSLGALATYFGVDLGDKHHTADADAEATSLVLERMVKAAAEKGWPTDVLSREKRRARLDGAQQKFDVALKDFEERKAKFIDAEEKAEKEELSIINNLSEWASKSEVLSIEYTKPNEKEPTKRSIVPIEVFDEKGKLYLRALDRDKGEERSFRVDRIGNIEPTGQVEKQEFGERQEWSFSGQGAGSRSRSSSNNKKGPSKKLTPEQVRISQEQKLRAKKIPGKKKDGPTKQEWGFRSRSASGAIGALADIDSLPNGQRDEDQKHLLRVMRQAKLKFEYSQDSRGGMIVDLRLTDEPRATADDAREAFANAMASDERASEILSSLGFDLDQRPWRDVRGQQGQRSRSARFMTGDGFNSDIRSVAAYTAARRAASNSRGSGTGSRSTSKDGRTEVAAEATFFKQILDSLPREISEARKANDRATVDALSELAQIMRRQKSAEVGPKRTNAGSLYLTQDETDQIIDALMFVLDRQTSNDGSRAPAFAKLIDMIAASAMSTFINRDTPEITDRFVMRENSQGRMVKVPIAR